MTGEREVIVIGRAPDAVSEAAERLLDGIIVALQDFTTDELEAIAQYRYELHPGGWMYQLINEYVEVWR